MRSQVTKRPPVSNVISAHSNIIDNHIKQTSRRRRQFLKYIARTLLLLLLTAGLLSSITPWGRAITRTAMVLPALIAATQPAPLVLTGEPIRHIQTTTIAQSGTVYLDIYEPSATQASVTDTQGSVLIIPGAGDNRQDPQLINLAQALARSGMTVMAMTTPTLMRFAIQSQDSDAVVQAFKKLSLFPGANKKHIGIIGFSAGVPLACFAAADPRIQRQVAYVVAFGGYFNTKNVLRAFGARSITVQGHSEQWQPTAVPLLVLSNIITASLSAAEREDIQQALPPGGHPMTRTELQTLSPAAQAAYHLLRGDEPASVDANIAQLPEETQAQLTQLSPSRVISHITAPIFLLHDRHDASLPVTESRDFAAALARLHHPYDYVEFHIFDHVEVRSHLETTQLLNDGSHLFSILTQILYLSA